jgi:hypothetical protein
VYKVKRKEKKENWLAHETTEATGILGALIYMGSIMCLQ